MLILSSQMLKMKRSCKKKRGGCRNSLPKEYRICYKPELKDYLSL